MVDVRIYYWASQILVINDWMTGVAGSGLSSEASSLGLDGIMEILYRAPIPASCADGTRVVFLTWLRHCGGLAGTAN